MVEEVPERADNEAWRREFLINPILTSPFALGFQPSEIGAEISYSVSDAEYKRLFKQFGLKKKRIRPDYVIVPTDNQLVAAVVEAKRRHSSLESHLRHASQVIIQQMITQAPWGLLTDGERWTLFRGDDSIMHLDSLEDVRRGMNDFRNLVGAQSVRNQLIHKQTLTVLLLSDTLQDSLQDSELFEKLRGRFPHLDKANFRVVSQASVEYNSPAAAAGDRQRWWWPDQTGWYYWPSGVKRAESLSAFIDAYTAIGYEVSMLPAREVGFSKIAFYGQPDGQPRHVAYQHASGLWASKLGQAEEIVHPLRAIEGDLFGQPIMFMRRSTD